MTTQSDRLATIVRIKEILPIEGADRIVVAKMEDNAWQVVVKKDEFQVGSLAVYICPDTIVDSSNPALAFMAERKSYVWPCRFKKQLSQGLLMPVQSLAYWGEVPPIFQGMDVSVFTKTQKYVRPEELTNNPQAESGFPAHLISRTDELNLLSYPKVLEELRGKDIVITLKMDGSSGTFFEKENVGFRACSRGQCLKSDADNGWNRMAAKYKLATTIANSGLIVQGEIVGPKFNGNKLGLTEEDLFVFDVYDSKLGVYFSPIRVKMFCDATGLKSVPILYSGKCEQSIEQLIDFASQQKYANGSPAEGIVIRSLDGAYSSELGKRQSVKVINPNFGVKK
jgi:RNA ligase (TIGR02306 family)